MKELLLIARNKDNKDIKDFKEKSEVHLLDNHSESFVEKIHTLFQNFTNKLPKGALARCYISVNERDTDKIEQDLAIKLIKKEVDISKINKHLCSIAMQPKNAKEKRWLFDIDTQDAEVLFQITNYILENSTNEGYELTPTINGYSLIVDKGFDTRELLKKYPDISLHRDGMLLIKWQHKE